MDAMQEKPAGIVLTVAQYERLRAARAARNRARVDDLKAQLPAVLPNDGRAAPITEDFDAWFRALPETTQGEIEVFIALVERYPLTDWMWLALAWTAHQMLVREQG